jgi:hypothetical protein
VSNGEQERSDAIVRAMLTKYFETHDIAAFDHRVQITSFGGCGTTALCDHLLQAGVDLPKSPGQWPFKHMAVPPAGKSVHRPFRVVYIYGDPRNAVVSIFRRGLQSGHYRALFMREPPPDVLERLSSLETFVLEGVDDFQLADHFERWWTQHGRDYPVLFLRYETLDESWPRVGEFLGLPPTVGSLPVTPRRSDWRGLPDPLRDRIDDMYRDLSERLDALPNAREH